MKRQVNLFPEYSHFPKDYVKMEHIRRDLDYDFDATKDELTSMVFAPDPVTGLPSSDVARILSSDTNPQVAQYIRDHLMSPNPNYQPGIDDPDLALYFVPRDGENFEQFSNRIRSKTQELYAQAVQQGFENNDLVSD